MKKEINTIRSKLLFCLTLLFVGGFAVTAQQPQLIVQLGHSGRINAAAFSPNGRLIVSGGDDPVAIVWEASTGKVLRRLVGHTNPVTAVAFSSDGRLVLTGGGDFSDELEDFTIRLWDVATGVVVQRFVSDNFYGEVRALAFSPDGQSFLSSGKKPEMASDAVINVHLWSLKTGKEVKNI